VKYDWDDKVKEDEMGGGACKHAEVRNLYAILVKKTDDKRPLGAPRHGWEDNTKTDLKEIKYEGVNWVHMAQNRIQWHEHMEPSDYT
jgi:hypothetical protein